MSYLHVTPDVLTYIVFMEILNQSKTVFMSFTVLFVLVSGQQHCRHVEPFPKEMRHIMDRDRRKKKIDTQTENKIS